MKIRSNGVIHVSVALGLLLCAQSALAQTRPNAISEVFQSPLAIEVTTATGVTRGSGKVIFDQPAGKAREYYRIQGSPRDEIITRYDLGAIFRNDRPTCDVTAVTGPMPSTWEWIANAKQGVGAVIGGVPVTFWESTGPTMVPPFSFGEARLRVAVRVDDENIPVAVELVQPERTVRLRFLNWRTTFRAKPSLFKLPRHCSS